MTRADKINLMTEKSESNSKKSLHEAQAAAIVMVPIGVIVKVEWLSLTILLSSLAAQIVILFLLARNSRRHRT